MRHTRHVLAVIATTLAAVTALNPPASAAPTVSDPIATGLAGPLQIDVGRHGILAAQSFAGLISRVGRDGSVTDVAAEPGWDVSGVAQGRYGVAYTTTLFNAETGASEESYLKVVGRDGTSRVVADLRGFEEEYNPDQVNTYGFLDLDAECAAQVPAEVGGGDPYPGQLDAHPYALANTRGGWYVADAGSNAILKVSRSGRIRVVSVPKPQPTVVTEEAATALGLPECTIGATYAFEPVPTDVEVTRKGRLVVSLLPGGPEGPELGPRGSVIKVNPWTGRSRVLATELAGATNVALAHGRVYVTELFGNRVSVIGRGGVSPVVELTSPAGLEYRYGRLFVSYDVFANGSIATIRL